MLLFPKGQMACLLGSMITLTFWESILSWMIPNLLPALGVDIDTPVDPYAGSLALAATLYAVTIGGVYAALCLIELAATFAAGSAAKRKG